MFKCRKIILASASPTRAEIMTNAGIVYEVNSTNIDENKIKVEFIKQKRPITELVEALALEKAKAAHANNGELIIGADQVLEFEGKVFDKPKTMAEARSRLLALRGQEHRLIGAVCVLQAGQEPVTQNKWVYISTTKLKMRNYSDAFLTDYLQKEGDSILTSVGAYKFEGLGAGLFESVQGDFFSILGLSLLPLMEELRRRGAILS